MSRLTHRCALIDGSSTRSTCFLFNDQLLHCDYCDYCDYGRAFQVLPHSGGIERTRQAERPGERPTSLGEI
jgi:hypothetical protein